MNEGDAGKSFTNSHALAISKAPEGFNWMSSFPNRSKIYTSLFAWLGVLIPNTCQVSLNPSPLGVKKLGKPITDMFFLTVPQSFLSLTYTV